MDLLVVRHAIAEDRAVFGKTGKDDGERPLTDAGRKRFEKGARGLRRLVPEIDLVATSTLARAVQTGELLADAFGGMRTVRIEELAPDASPEALLPWLRGQRRRELVAIVGHEPHLSTLVELLLTGRQTGFVELKKGGACLLALPKAAAPGGAELRWLLTAGQLRRLAR
jgi:phosphohistidine phosphatase